MPPVSERAGRAPRDVLVAHLRDLKSKLGDATLTLERGPFGAQVRVHGGRVTDCVVDTLRGERAFGRALSASHGTWRLTRVDGARGTPFAPVDELIANVDARREHITELATAVGGLDRVWTVLFRVLRRELPHIPDDVNPLLRLVDGKRTVDRVLAESPFDEILTLRILHRLLSKGILVLPDLPDGISPIDDAAASTMADVFARSVVPTPSDGAHLTLPASTEVAEPAPLAPPQSAEPAPDRVEPRPLPAPDDDDTGAPFEAGQAGVVTVKAWSSKRERPPGAVPDDFADDFSDETADDIAHDVVADDVAAVHVGDDVTDDMAPGAVVETVEDRELEPVALDPPIPSVEGALDAHEGFAASDDDARHVVTEPALPSEELTDWLDEEHAFFTRDAPTRTGAPEPVVAAPSTSERITLYAVLFLVSVLLAFVAVRLFTQGADEEPAAPAGTVVDEGSADDAAP
jgi:hypothetical protein